MLEGKGVIEDTDMPVKMQIQAMRWASQALDVYDVLDYRSIAAHIKKVNLCVFELNYLFKLYHTPSSPGRVLIVLHSLRE